MSRTSNSDLYNVLEVSPRASTEVIHAAYRILAKQNIDNEKWMRILNEAKETLLDEGKREKYDASRDITKGKLGNYRILEKIAEGGFGVTYKGEHIMTKAPVCIKHCLQVSAQDEEILLQEANAMWDLRHYGIPTIRDIQRVEDGSLALIMSYIPGPTLWQLAEKYGDMDAEHVAWITERVLNILKYIHFHGVVHGDMKPQNIIVQTESHTVVLVDFGLSLIRPSARTTNKGYTAPFAAPEQLKGDTLLPETDFYGLGLSMIHCLGGDISNKKVPSSTPDPLCDFIRRLITYDVLSRPNWDKEDLMLTLQNVRLKAFGRKSSDMKPLT